MQCLVLACLTAFAVPWALLAQEMDGSTSDGGMEIGTLFGLSVLSPGDDATTLVAVPGVPGGVIGNPSVVLSWFPTEQLSLGPEFSLGRFSIDEDSFSSLYLGVRGAHLPRGAAADGPYLLGHAALWVVDGSGTESDTDFAAGAGVGYQRRLGPALVLRTEGRYRRWFDVEENDFSLLLGLGTRTGRLAAHKGPRAREVEIGTLFGLSRRVVELQSFFGGSDSVTLTHSGIPAGPGLALHPSRHPHYIPSLYVSWFPSEKLSVGPVFSLGRISQDGSSFTTLHLEGRTAFHIRSSTMSGAYLLARGALAAVAGDSESETDSSAGAGLGYQWRLGSALVLRAEGGYRRWFDGEVNDFSLLLGLGTRLGGR